MIPLKLGLRNFMCYRGYIEPLDFAGIHLACLTGDNGHGKSALLDAITWSLWGKARAKRDDELITLGEQEMEVCFDFSLNDEHYRVIRKRDSRHRGKSILEFQVMHKEVFRPLTGPTIRETQGAINDVLCMDYETFINSSFLLQGRADEFTVKPPAQRKQVLADILGLDMYDQYEQRAKELIRANGTEQHEIEARVQEMDLELEKELAYQQEATEAQTVVEQTAADLAREQETLDNLRARTQELRQYQDQARELGSRIANQEHELAEIVRQVGEHNQELARYQQIVLRCEEIDAGYERLSEAKNREKALNKALAQFLGLSKKRETLERAIDDAVAKMRTQHTLLLSKVADLDRTASRRGYLEERLSVIKSKLVGAADLEAWREEAQEKAQNESSILTQLGAANRQLKEEMDKLRERIIGLQGAGATCPLCGQGLSKDHLQNVIDDLESEGKLRGERYRSNRVKEREANERAAALAQRIKALSTELRDKAKWQKEEGQLEQAVSDAATADDLLPDLVKEAAGLRAEIAAGNFATEERFRLETILAEISQLDYDSAVHTALSQIIEDLNHYETEKREQVNTLHKIEAERAVLKSLRDTEERDRIRLGKDKADYSELSQKIETLPFVLGRLQDVEQEVEVLRRQEADARLILGATRQKLEHCRYLKKKRAAAKDREREVAEEKGIYEELRLAFGKKGIQAMIIEAIVPEIEDEANILLARMTDGRMHVRFDTQRTTLKGDVVETLGISISDELGPRSYELYSGGEAFRVNFAIRIALSKLLARRAGAQLQTLVIDEGFGSQDAQGRERLVEAINAIKDEFVRILVITHIEELRDAFPTRIDVVKTTEGSRIYIKG